MVTSPPSVDIVVGEEDVIMAFTFNKNPLDSPIGSVLIFKLYYPASILGKLKTTVVAFEL
jgi:hypothetical protein